MTDYIDDLPYMNLFSGISPEDLPNLLSCLHARCEHYKKDDLIIEEGSHVFEFGIMLSGHGRSIKWDASGRVILITLLKKGSEIGVILAASIDHKSPVSVQAQDDVSVLMIPYDRVLARCAQGCSCHETLLRNYINIVAEKGLVLHERIDCLLRPTARGKIIAFLERLSRDQHNREVTAPFNRNAMSEYLDIERSALSRELSNMKMDGLIEYHRENFKLLWE